jgi:hypothetical protein
LKDGANSEVPVTSIRSAVFIISFNYIVFI